MTNKDDIKFFANDETNTRCFPATIGMILSKLLPEREFTLEELIKLSGSVEGMSTWPSRMLIELEKMGLDAVMVEAFDGKAFIREGADYLRREFGEQTATWQIENSDIEKEQRDYAEMYEKGVKVENRIPTTQDIQKYMDNGYMVKVTVNSHRLSNEPGYVGHSVLVLALEDDEVVIHNPGLPPQPFQHVGMETFEAAWASPNEKAKELIAIRRLK